MCDLDPSASRQTSTFNSSVLQNNRASPLIPVVELFLASVQAIELANARAAYEGTTEPPRPVENVPGLVTASGGCASGSRSFLRTPAAAATDGERPTVGTSAFG